MRCVLQRVLEARVDIDGETVGAIEQGLMILVGVGEGDTESDARYLADKTAVLRIFSDDADKMNLSILDVQGSALVVSQFTLLADCRKGRRPAFTGAAEPQIANRLYQSYCQRLVEQGIEVQTGRFAADMQVHLINDGPVTILLESPPKAKEDSNSG
ncbi:D-tyrosyl-tRNA(Tyr) deacylase [Roseimaritima multifibrata]|uniref:D-aminoacyl-tRNA deacylase n=1 Tax=Roseimaritima multifibrata TaxID=1930274 RepID=A0A517MLP8_9BACT|nr:D-aminoacyl-tRNA deacylase [Roseimaritima multifibrata]QDS95803.1 D-tyrosyl-tRNA(Tyr) deacylase [Roseimaritima multifibrata]